MPSIYRRYFLQVGSPPSLLFCTFYVLQCRNVSHLTVSTNGYRAALLDFRIFVAARPCIQDMLFAERPGRKWSLLDPCEQHLSAMQSYRRNSIHVLCNVGHLYAERTLLESSVFDLVARKLH